MFPSTKHSLGQKCQKYGTTVKGGRETRRTGCGWENDFIAPVQIVSIAAISLILFYCMLLYTVCYIQYVSYCFILNII